jgi:hypothetical protein
MRAIYIPIALLLLVSCSKVNNSKRTESDIYSANKIKTKTEYISRINLGIEEKEHVKEIKEFNSKGLATKETIYKNDGSLQTITTFEYDPDNNLIKTRKVSKDSSFLVKYISSYDAKNHLTEQYCYEESENGPFLYHKVFGYDGNGKLMTVNWYWPTGKRAVDKYIYEGNNAKEFTESNSYGDLLFKWTYKYDNRNNLIESIQYYDSVAINAKIVYVYNPNNEMVKQTKYNKTVVDYTAAYEYDDKGLLTAKTEFALSGKAMAKYKYKYGTY